MSPMRRMDCIYNLIDRYPETVYIIDARFRSGEGSDQSDEAPRVWVDLDIRAIVADDRFDYGETRFRAYGRLDGIAHCLVFTIRDGRYRPISLRRAHAKEMRRHAP